ncbi:hypothetical protein MKX01_034846 [Papaver californicum]|nr:hypothetical protein MKX01_034846 [Papaver californicum]
MSSLSISSKPLRFSIINLISIFIIIFYMNSITARHSITFRSKNLYPESIVWDQFAQHFLISSLYYPKISSVSDAERPHFDALASYDLRSRQRLFLSPLTDDYDVNPIRPIANDVTLKSDKMWSFCGLNGIAYVSKGYLLVVQSNTGKMFKVDEDNGKAKVVLLNKNLTAVDGIAVRDDGDVVAVSHHTAWLLKSDDSWGEGVVYDEIALDVKKFASGIAVRNDNRRVYVLYGNVDEPLMGHMGGENKIWIYVFVGFGFAYFMFWRFQMRHLAKNMNKKTA